MFENEKVESNHTWDTLFAGKEKHNLSKSGDDDNRENGPPLRSRVRRSSQKFREGENR